MDHIGKMMNKKGVILRKGKDKAIRNRHHWIFSGAVLSLPNFMDGEILPVYTEEGIQLGSGYFNRKAKIIGRMLCFDDQDPLIAIRNSLDKAIQLREILFFKKETNAFRLINGEGDCLPGLIVDRYADGLVMQLGTLGMEKLRPWLVDYLINKLSPKVIYEKSLLPSRKEEGLEDFQNTLYGEKIHDITIRENGLQFIVSPETGQKTGFFLDHREMRQWVRTIAADRKVLNCFSYTGGFSIYAAAGGALQVDSIDISEKAIELGKRNALLNNVEEKCSFRVADVFNFLREHSLPYDLVILDPPAFAKRQKDVTAACRGYKDINRIAIQKMPRNSLLLTSSCSYHVDEDLFQKVVFQASLEAKRTVRIIGRHLLAPDHPINICHPESDYLKSLIIFIE